MRATTTNAEETISKKKKLKEKLRAAMNGAATGEKPDAMVRDHEAHVLVCAGGDCKKRGAREVRKTLKEGIRARDLIGEVRVDTVDCLGLCKHGPNVVVHDNTRPKSTWYLGLDERRTGEVVQGHLEGGEPVEHLAAERRPRKAKKRK